MKHVIPTEAEESQTNSYFHIQLIEILRQAQNDILWSFLNFQTASLFFYSIKD